jgi:hypothetical protein
VKRPYAHWQHAERLSGTDGGELHRVDIVTTLKRAVDVRLRALNQTYRFKSIPIRDRSTDIYAWLQQLGIIRRAMVEKLFTMRNAIEHEDQKPPRVQRARSLSSSPGTFCDPLTD